MLTDEGTTIVKVFLTSRRTSRRKRFRERIDDPEKRWKFRKADLDVHERYDEYVAAYEERDRGDVDPLGARGTSSRPTATGSRRTRSRRCSSTRWRSSIRSSRPREAGIEQIEFD